MPGEPERRRALLRVPLVALSGPFHRFVDFWFVHNQLAAGKTPSILSGLGARLFGGRFTPPNLFETLYVSTTVQTAQIEAEFPFLGSGVVSTLRPAKPFVHFGIDGQLSRVLDLTVTDPTVISALGLTVGEIHAPWRFIQALGGEAPTQTLGRFVYETGKIEAIFYPSSKHKPDGRCLAILPERLSSPSWIEISDETGRFRERIPPP